MLTASNMLVVAYDAGGAELLSSYMKSENISCPVVVDGPAKTIFSKKLPNLVFNTLEEALKKADWILSGTGWQTDFEFRAMKMARSEGKTIVAFLDHWSNYQERFIRGDLQVLPDEVWVADEYAYDIAVEKLPDVPVTIKGNPYLKEIKSNFNELNLKPIIGKALYVAEPIREHVLREYGNEKHYGFVEEDALKFFLDNIINLDVGINAVNIRPHPSEPKDKYNWAIHYGVICVNIVGNKSLMEEIAEAEFVVGCHSMAMVVALSVGKKTFSSIPIQGTSPCLPHKDIVYIREKFLS